ncbi:hypothetical protein PROFUN_03012 [Planoprotostelium fungivorum]|uniref:Uncharacterized protein n=1 Tax=Planoprotostelium fungivorum TaxID=1890364 RepID=A0A2P6NXC0_9EUKA|nr:hypothetical protein PROFUN_03012 [Planoprotostelium fungivorum]
MKKRRIGEASVSQKEIQSHLDFCAIGIGMHQEEQGPKGGTPGHVTLKSADLANFHGCPHKLSSDQEHMGLDLF